MGECPVNEYRRGFLFLKNTLDDMTSWEMLWRSVVSWLEKARPPPPLVMPKPF
jgi:hypothetical protein